MTQEQKYKLSEPTEDEKKKFLKDFEELCKKHLMYFEPVPQFSRVDMKSPWLVHCQIWLQKKTEVVEVEKDSIPSPFKGDEKPNEPTPAS